MSKKYYRAKEAAKYLGVGLSTIWLWNQQAKLHSKKLSARVTVFHIDDLNNLANDIPVGQNHD